MRVREHRRRQLGLWIGARGSGRKSSDQSLACIAEGGLHFFYLVSSLQMGLILALETE